MEAGGLAANFQGAGITEVLKNGPEVYILPCEV